MIDREFVRTHRRRRLTLGVGETVSERGYAATTVTDIVRAAGVARNTFYEQFPNKETVFLALLGESYAELLDRSHTACAAAPSVPSEKIAAGLGAVLVWMDENPALADCCFVEALCAGEAGRELKAAAEDRFAELLRNANDGQQDTQPLRQELLIGGVAAVLSQIVLAGQTAVDRLGDLSSFLTGSS